MCIHRFQWDRFFRKQKTLRARLVSRARVKLVTTSPEQKIAMVIPHLSSTERPPPRRANRESVRGDDRPELSKPSVFSQCRTRDTARASCVGMRIEPRSGPPAALRRTRRRRVADTHTAQAVEHRRQLRFVTAHVTAAARLARHTQQLPPCRGATSMGEPPAKCRKTWFAAGRPTVRLVLHKF